MTTLFIMSNEPYQIQKNKLMTWKKNMPYLIFSQVLSSSSRPLAANGMKIILLFNYFLAFAFIGLIEGTPSRVARSTDPEAYLQFLGTARDVLDRVPLIDGYLLLNVNQLFFYTYTIFYYILVGTKTQ